MTAADVLHARLFVRADEVVEIARAVGVDVAVAAVLLEKESGGGQNVWGHDGVETGGAYVKGAPVTRESYLQYRELVGQKRIGRQGVGPTQLTNGDLQDQADRLGGCWDWRVNVRVGLAHLKGLQQRHGVRGGFVAYNGGPGALTKPPTHPAQLYGDDAVRRLALWTARLADQNVTSNTPEEPDMLPDERAALLAVASKVDTLTAEVAKLKPGVRLPGRSAGTASTLDDEFGWTMTAAGRADDAAKGVARIAAQLDRFETQEAHGELIDYTALARAIVAELAGKVKA